MSYILRIAIHEKSWERQLSEIIQLCKDVNIEEVYLMEQCHQVIMSPYPISKHKRMANIYKKMKVELERNGIIYSVNIATIIGHCDTKTSSS